MSLNVENFLNADNDKERTNLLKSMNFDEMLELVDFIRSIDGLLE